MSPIQLPTCSDCNDNIPHAVAGYCLVSDGSPVLVLTLVDCTTGTVSTSLINPDDGSVIPNEPIQACASLSLASLSTVDCDGVASIVEAIPVVHQGVLTAELCDATIISTKDAAVANLGHEVITVPNSPATIGLTVPANTDIALIENFFSSNRSVRWRGDGTLPVGGGNSGAGHWLTPGTSIEYTGDPTNILFTKDIAGGTAVLEVSYYQYI